MEQAKLTNQKETLVFLQKEYPQCFVANGKVKPLKIGIFQDLAKALEDKDIVSKRLLRMSLRHYTSSWRYLSAVKVGTPRVDLDGNEGEAVELQHAEHAAEQLKESKARAAKSREANDKKADSSKANKHKGFVEKNGDSASESNTGDKASTSKRTKSFPSRKKPSQKPKQNLTNKAAPIKVTENVSDTDIQVGATALVKLGKEPMPVTITDIGKDGISVQLKSGMTVRVQQEQLYKTS